MNTTSLISSSTSINQEYNNSTNNSNINKEKNDAFESLISSTKTSNTTKAIKEEDVIVYKSSTQSLYEDIISLLKTGFTVGELKAFEEKLKEILKMKDDEKTSINEIEAALKKLNMEILEAKKRVSGQIIKKSEDNSIQSKNSTLDDGSFDFDAVVTNIKNMLQEIKNSSKNTNTNDKDEENNEAYDKLKLILKMS
jgi:hypothetical protein